MEQKTSIGSAAWGFRELKLPEQLALAKKLGMACHELGIANAETDIPLDASGEALEEVKALYRAYDIGLLCAATGNDFTGPDAWEQVEKVRKVIRMCARLGIKMLRIFTGFTPLEDMDSQKWKTLEDCLADVARAAGEQGVALCVETHGAVEPMLDGVKHIRSTSTQLARLPDMKLVFDPGNLSAVGEGDLEGFFEAVKDRIGYIHLKDFRRGAGGQLYPCALGEGSTDWKGLLPKLAAAGVPVLFEYEDPQDLERGLEKCAQYWKEHVK